MTKLFVANLSKQHHEFHYRIPEGDRTKALAPVMIPVGQQRQVGGDLRLEDIALIVEDCARYGIVSSDEIKNRREFTGLCYRIAKPVPIDTFYESYEKNDEALDERSADIRQEAATAMANQIEETLHTPHSRVTLHRTEVELVEQTPGTPKIAEGIEVLAEGTLPRHEAQRQPRKR